MSSHVKTVCDNCGNEVDGQGAPYWAGGSAMQGWYTLQGPVNNTLAMGGNHVRHLCSEECLKHFVVNRRLR